LIDDVTRFAFLPAVFILQTCFKLKFQPPAVYEVKVDGSYPNCLFRRIGHHYSGASVLIVRNKRSANSDIDRLRFSGHTVSTGFLDMFKFELSEADRLHMDVNPFKSTVKKRRQRLSY
jgi:hypothetical protein